MKLVRLSGIALLCGLASIASAQGTTVERTFKGSAGKAIQIGLYLNIKPDCTSGLLPTIRLSSPPANGKVVVKKANVSATNLKQCLALEVPGLVAFYQSRSDFVGSDTLTLEVKFPGGRTEFQKITVTVAPSSPNQGV